MAGRACASTAIAGSASAAAGRRPPRDGPAWGSRAEKVGSVVVPSSERLGSSWLPRAASSINSLHGHRGLCVGPGRPSGAAGWSGVTLKGRKSRFDAGLRECRPARVPGCNV
jgi:hypothetical protein